MHLSFSVYLKTFHAQTNNDSKRFRSRRKEANNFSLRIKKEEPPRAPKHFVWVANAK